MDTAEFETLHSHFPISYRGFVVKQYFFFLLLVLVIVEDWQLRLDLCVRLVMGLNYD